jgi:hypothetical protein
VKGVWGNASGLRNLHTTANSLACQRRVAQPTNERARAIATRVVGGFLQDRAQSPSRIRRRGCFGVSTAARVATFRLWFADMVRAIVAVLTCLLGVAFAARASADYVNLTLITDGMRSNEYLSLRCESLGKLSLAPPTGENIVELECVHRSDAVSGRLLRVFQTQEHVNHGRVEFFRQASSAQTAVLYAHFVFASGQVVGLEPFMTLSKVGEERIRIRAINGAFSFL